MSDRKNTNENKSEESSRTETKGNEVGGSRKSSLVERLLRIQANEESVEPSGEASKKSINSKKTVEDEEKKNFGEVSRSPFTTGSRKSFAERFLGQSQSKQSITEGAGSASSQSVRKSIHSQEVEEEIFSNSRSPSGKTPVGGTRSFFGLLRQPDQPMPSYGSLSLKTEIDSDIDKSNPARLVSSSKNRWTSISSITGKKKNDLDESEEEEERDDQQVCCIKTSAQPPVKSPVQSPVQSPASTVDSRANKRFSGGGYFTTRRPDSSRDGELSAGKVLRESGPLVRHLTKADLHQLAQLESAITLDEDRLTEAVLTALVEVCGSLSYVYEEGGVVVGALYAHRISSLEDLRRLKPRSSSDPTSLQSDSGQVAHIIALRVVSPGGAESVHARRVARELRDQFLADSFTDNRVVQAAVLVRCSHSASEEWVDYEQLEEYVRRGDDPVLCLHAEAGGRVSDILGDERGAGIKRCKDGRVLIVYPRPAPSPFQEVGPSSLLSRLLPTRTPAAATSDKGTGRSEEKDRKDSAQAEGTLPPRGKNGGYPAECLLGKLEHHAQTQGGKLCWGFVRSEPSWTAAPPRVALDSSYTYQVSRSL
jgi:hypothetical protein